MEKKDIIKTLAKRSGGDIYLGVVGAVRTGKSTFIKKFMETCIIPNIADEYEQKRAMDELPQSAQGKTIMTIEPKFVPSNAAAIKIEDFSAKVRLVDCVGYVIDEAKGYEDENGPRMVRTPWYDEEIPFIEAAEIGTEKVIRDHSSIGIIVTTDGSIGEIKRKSYEEVEDRIINELKELGKPFIVLLNTKNPTSPDVLHICENLNRMHNVPVIPMNVDSMSEKDATYLLKEALFEFPVLEVNVNMPEWVARLHPEHWLKKNYINNIKESVITIDKLRDVETITGYFEENEYITRVYLSNVDPATGVVTLTIETPEYLYDEVLKEIVGVTVKSRADLLGLFQDYNEAKLEYDQIKTALKMVKQTGYGIATPTISDMKLETPEIVKQGSRYGVKLKAVAPSIHMIRVDVESTFEPIIGSELQSKELINYLMKDYEESADNIWKSEIFGRSLDVIVSEGINAKLAVMPEHTRYKLQQTLTKIINKGTGNMIAIVL